MKKVLKIFVLAAIISVLITLPAQAKVRGVTDTSIKIGGLYGFTGPYKATGADVRRGLLAWFSYVNDKGGIHGRKLKAVIEDNAGKPATTITAANKLIFRDKVFCLAGVHGAAAFQSIYDLVEKEKVPSFSLGYATSNYIPLKKMIFMVSVPYYYEAARGLTYFMEDLKIKNPKLAVLYQDDAYGYDCLNGVRAEAKAWGINILKEVSYPRGTMDFAAQTANLKRSGAEHIVMGTVYVQTGLVLKEAKKLNYNPMMIGIMPSIHPTLFKVAGDATKGFLASDCRGKPGQKAMAEVEGIVKKYADCEVNNQILMGLTIAQAIEGGLQRAGRNLTVDSFIKGLESLKNYDMKGTVPNLHFGPKRHYSTAKSRVFEAQPATRSWKEVAPPKLPKIAR